MPDESNRGIEHPPHNAVPPPAEPGNGKPNGADRLDKPAPDNVTPLAKGKTARAKADTPQPEAAPESVFDDLESLRRTAILKVSRRVIPVNVTVQKPKNNVYFRCHPDPAMTLDASIIIGAEGSDDYYFVMPYMLTHRVVAPRLRQVTIAVVYTWPGGVVSLWPVPNVAETRIACWKSAREAFEQSKTVWVQLIWNSDRRDYDVIAAEDIPTEPIWPPDLDLTKLLKLGFADRIIASPDHPYVKQLRGLAD
jgi:hypothetical protein